MRRTHQLHGVLVLLSHQQRVEAATTTYHALEVVQRQVKLNDDLDVGVVQATGASGLGGDHNLRTGSEVHQSTIRCRDNDAAAYVRDALCELVLHCLDVTRPHATDDHARRHT